MDPPPYGSTGIRHKTCKSRNPKKADMVVSTKHRTARPHRPAMACDPCPQVRCGDVVTRGPSRLHEAACQMAVPPTAMAAGCSEKLICEGMPRYW